MHEILIGFLIVAIVSIQTYVFYITFQKIKNYKNIIPKQDNFKTVKVYLKETEIDSISIVNIYKNLPKFSSTSRQKLNVVSSYNEKKIKTEKPENTEYNVTNDIKEIEYVENVNSEFFNENDKLETNTDSENIESETVLKIEADKKSIIINQEVNIKITINKVGADVTFKSFDGFKLIRGPKLEVIKSWVNGKLVYSKTYTYVLKPLKTGDLIIQKVTANFHGAVFESNSITINVKEY